jgi:hypothetical protein
MEGLIRESSSQALLRCSRRNRALPKLVYDHLRFDGPIGESATASHVAVGLGHVQESLTPLLLNRPNRGHHQARAQEGSEWRS